MCLIGRRGDRPTRQGHPPLHVSPRAHRTPTHLTVPSPLWQLAAVFSMQGVGRILCAVVLLFSTYCIKDTNWQWRFAILMGAVPMMGAFWFRWWVCRATLRNLGPNAATTVLSALP